MPLWPAYRPSYFRICGSDLVTSKLVLGWCGAVDKLCHPGGEFRGGLSLSSGSLFCVVGRVPGLGPVERGS